MDVGKETADNDPETVTGYRPSRMFATGTATEVLPGHKYLSPINRVIQYKILVHCSVSIVTPVTEQVLAEKALFSCRGFQEACRNNLVGIHILQRKRHTCTCYDIEFLFHSSITLMFADRLSLLSRLRLRPPTDWPKPYAHRDLDVLQNYGWK